MGNDRGLPRGFELRDVEETEDALRIREQLIRIRVFLLESDAYTEMVDTVDYLIEDNERLIDPEIEKNLLAGKLGEWPAASRYGATTPALLNWLKRFNRERAYDDQMKPFNFLNSFQARLPLHLSDAEQLAIPRHGRPRKQSLIKPVGPFDKDMRKAAIRV